MKEWEYWDRNVPKGLEDLQYATHLLVEVIGMPAKGNLELAADCIGSLRVKKRWDGQQAYRYILRAVKLAEEQGITVDYLWLKNAEYLKMRPEKPNLSAPEWKRIDWQEVADHQKTPEFQAVLKQMEEKCSKIWGIPISKGTTSVR